MRYDRSQMGRPRIYTEPRVNTAVRIPESLHERLAQTAEERDLGINLLILRAIENYLDRLDESTTSTRGRRK
jgi:predicted HicB family RNase H-like nuclease